MTSRKPPIPAEFRALQKKLAAQVALMQRPEWRRAWAALPENFRITLFRNAGLNEREAGGPLSHVPDSDLVKLLLAAERYEDYCKRAASILFSERGARE